MDVKNKFDGTVVDNAIEKGLAYLISQSANGRWRGFPTLAGESDLWVTGFILAHISKLCINNSVVTESQKFLLENRHVSGGWSYSSIVPPDADSTSWCIMALQSNNKLTSIELEQAKSFLWSHLKNDGLSTYTIDSGISEFIGAPSIDLLAGWVSPHPDVSIAAVLADIQNKNAPEIISWLFNLQTSSGFINAYWWRSQLYTTTLLLRALNNLKLHLPSKNATILAAALVVAQLADGSFALDTYVESDAFTTALALEAFTHLSYIGKNEEKNSCGNALLQLQEPNGSWAGNYILRIPAPFVTDPGQVSSWNNADGGGNSLIKDTDGLFATAMACYALDCWRQTEIKNNVSEEWPAFQLRNEEMIFFNAVQNTNSQ